MSKGWKYSLIKVAIDNEGTDHEEQVNLLVELYPLGDNEEYNSFCNARLMSIEELQIAQKDIGRDGINEWFFDHGVFAHKVCDNCLHGDWDWTPNDSSKDSAGMVSDTIAKINLKQKYNNSGEQ